MDTDRLRGTDDGRAAPVAPGVLLAGVLAVAGSFIAVLALPSAGPASDGRLFAALATALPLSLVLLATLLWGGRPARRTPSASPHFGPVTEADLRRAIASDALTIHYQPLVQGTDGRMTGVEALVRWHHPRLGPISPDDFIPLAERCGLIGAIGTKVLRQACADGRRWNGLRVAVNLSPAQFREAGFVAATLRTIDESGIDPALLDLELTEGVLIQDADQAEAVIADLRAHGMRMGLDDFGSGYSSVIYLRRFAFDKIKIDKALLAALDTKGEGAIILQSIVTLGHALGLVVTAEGVETDEQFAFLRQLGCDELQGYLFGEALPACEIDKRLAQPGPCAIRPFIAA